MAESNGRFGSLHLRPGFLYTLAGGLIAIGTWVGWANLSSLYMQKQITIHVAKPAHEQALERITTVETRYEAVREDLAEMKGLLLSIHKRLYEKQP